MSTRKIAWVSPARFEPFLVECEGDEDLAWKLYEWNAKVASALFECFHHVEVLLRNAMMSRLSQLHPLAYPWQQDLASVVRAAGRRRDPATGVASPDSIIAELPLGFWTEFLQSRPANEELWRRQLRHVFPGSPGTREAVRRVVSDMQSLRNRCAHQDSLLECDPGIELQKLLSLVDWIDPEARPWLESLETVSAVADARPVQPVRNVVVVAASEERALAMYAQVAAYVCPSDRKFARVEYIGFYVDKRIEPYFAAIENTVVPARWNAEEARRLRGAVSKIDRRVGQIMGYALRNGWAPGGQYQVFVLSDTASPRTQWRETAIVHRKTGRGSAFVQSKRYFAKAALLAAEDTAQLEH